jgi:hypothetical protein
MACGMDLGEDTTAPPRSQRRVWKLYGSNRPGSPAPPIGYRANEMSADWDALRRVLAVAGADLRCPACGQVEMREDDSVMISRQNLWLIALCDRCGFSRLHRRDTLRASG